MALILFKIDHLNVYKSYLENRDMLINMLDNKEIDKTEFLAQNYRLINQISVTPRTTIDSIEEGVFGYQYYNGLAKYYSSLLSDLPNLQKNNKKAIELRNKIGNYYREKDKQTLALLEFVKYQGIEAYYVKMESKRLEGTIFEIYFKNYSKMIFHSKSQKIKENLVKHKVFLSDIQNSKIENYLNTKY